MGRPGSASGPRCHHVEQLPRQPSPDVPVRRSYCRPQLRVQVRQGLRRRYPQVQVLGGEPLQQISLETFLPWPNAWTGLADRTKPGTLFTFIIYQCL
jgi:hypothetical protein